MLGVGGSAQKFKTQKSYFDNNYFLETNYTFSPTVVRSERTRTVGARVLWNTLNTLKLALLAASRRANFR